MRDRQRRGSDRGPGGRPGRGGDRFGRDSDRFSRDDRPRPERIRLAPYPERPRPSFTELFRPTKPLIGVVHLKPLPGSPGYDGLFLDLLDRALNDARAIEAGGAAAMIVENYGDAPFYPDSVPPETIAAMTRLVTEIRKLVRIPVGVNVLRNDARGGVAVAAATGAGFVRVNVHTGAMVTDQGLIMGRAWESVRLRETLRSRTLLFADIRVKHAQPLVDVSLVQEAEDCARRGRADALIITGEATGRPADLARVAEIKARMPNVPVLVGSGVTLDSLESVLRVADGCIVGTALKEGGRIEAPVDVDHVRSMAVVAERIAPRTLVDRPRFAEAPPRNYGDAPPRTYADAPPRNYQEGPPPRRYEEPSPHAAGTLPERRPWAESTSEVPGATHPAQEEGAPAGDATHEKPAASIGRPGPGASEPDNLSTALMEGEAETPAGEMVPQEPLAASDGAEAAEPVQFGRRLVRKRRR